MIYPSRCSLVNYWITKLSLAGGKPEDPKETDFIHGNIRVSTRCTQIGRLLLDKPSLC